MAHHMEVMDQPFLDGAINIFLIRDPRQIIASYAQVIYSPVMRDIGIAHEHHLYETLLRKGEKPIIVDSGTLLAAPEAMLRKISSACSIPFDPNMLSWNAGPKPYDGAWAPHWYSNVHRSTGFRPKESSARPLPEHLEGLYAEARKYYEILHAQSIKT